MIDMRRGYADDLEELCHEMEVVVDEVEGWRRLDPVSVNFGRTSSMDAQHLQHGPSRLFGRNGWTAGGVGHLDR